MKLLCYLSKIVLAVVALAALTPTPLFACAACFGKSSDPLAHGMNWGIFTLLGVIVSVLTCSAVFFVHIVRREAAMTKTATPAKLPA